MLPSEISHTANNRGWTLLVRTAKAGNDRVVTVLLAHGGVDVEARDYDSCTPLALAARNGHVAVVARLLAHGANPNLQDLWQAAPLWHAAKHGHTAVVRLFEESGTPLVIALKRGHRLLALLDGIDTCVKTGSLYNKNESVLGLAVLDGYEDMALALLNKCDSGKCSDDSDSSDGGPDNIAKDAVEPASKLLVLAGASGCLGIVQKLLAKHGAEVNAVYSYAQHPNRYFQQSPPMAASRRGEAGVVRLLLDAEGILPSLSGGYSETALILAAQGRFVDVVKMLVADTRVKVDQKDGGGRTALSHAAEHAHEAVVAELLATRMVNPDSQDDDRVGANDRSCPRT
ncbi:ankyrin repeat-containing domain protein [Ustulina deusta]|nr:ankyrin repeat-containing domain protein [Ustulina deusta]